MAKETGANTHRATTSGYAKTGKDKTGFVLVPAGEFVPAGNVVSEEWMEEVSKKDAKVIRAAQEAEDPQPGDVDLTQLSEPALQALAAERGVNVKGLNKKDLIAAIKAAHAKDAG